MCATCVYVGAAFSCGTWLQIMAHGATGGERRVGVQARLVVSIISPILTSASLSHSLSICLALCVLPLKLLMWQIHKIKRKSSHNEHFLLPYLRYFIIIFLRCRHSQCVCENKMAALLYLSDMSCHKLTQTHTHTHVCVYSADTNPISLRSALWAGQCADKQPKMANCLMRRFNGIPCADYGHKYGNRERQGETGRESERGGRKGTQKEI